MRLLIDLDPQDARRGLATDEALLESVRDGGADAVRLWVNERSVIVGRSQAVADEVDVEFAARSRIPVLRRISGGGTVYHYPGNLNAAVVLRGGRRIGSVSETFGLFGRAIATAVGEICPAASSVDNSFLMEDRKIGGAAQARRGDAVLYHTTLLVRRVDVPMSELLLAMRPGYRPGRVASKPRETISLSEALGIDVEMDRVAALLVPALSETLNEPLDVGCIDAEEAARAGWLAENKYGDPEWNRSL